MEKIFSAILNTRADPLDVLKTTAYVVENARYVRIDLKSIERAADALVEKQIAPPAWSYDFHYHDGTPRTVNYLFLLDTLNFCFWGKPKWSIKYTPVIASRTRYAASLSVNSAAKQSPTNSETLAPHASAGVASAHKPRLAMTQQLDGYWALAASLKRAVEKNPHTLDADFLARVTPQEFAEILRGNTTIPLFTERWRNVRELGTVLRDRWNGSAAQLVQAAQGDAARLARMIAENLASFDDVAVYETRDGETGRGDAETREASPSPNLPVSHSHHTTSKHPVHFYKRAQILVADLWGAFGGKDWGEFENIDQLTAFADYKLPQILRAWGILKYTPTLARKVDAQIELAAGSPAEIEIRSAMLWAVEFLREALAQRGRTLRSTQVDWILWQASQGRIEGMKPYHRVRTIYY
jgi:hypothetical protein